MRLMTLSKNLHAKSQAVGDSSLANHLCEDPCAERMLRAGRYCLLLKDTAGGWEADATAAAVDSLERAMAFVPSGVAEIHPITTTDTALQANSRHGLTVLSEDSFLIDRYAVSNDQFERFVAADGYRQEEYWPEEILPLVFQFVDQTNHVGPAFWSDGRPPEAMGEHPVVGVSWYEANAYAMWAGKQLPSSVQWQRAGTWWRPHVRYPWGDGFELGRANTASSSRNGTSVVGDYAAGATPNGIFQLVGNVWEWVYASIGAVDLEGSKAPLMVPLGEIRGGAFDTYLSSQATCLFRSGRTLLARGANVGFRCCIASPDVQRLVAKVN